MKVPFLPAFALIVTTMWLAGCTTSPSMMNGYLGDEVTPPSEAHIPAALLEFEKRNWRFSDHSGGWLARKTEEDQRAIAQTGVQQVFTASRKPYVLGFAQQHAANRVNWRQLRKNALDLTNVGMHLFSGGATLAPLWMAAWDIDTHVISKSIERKMMRMPSLTLYAPYPELGERPLDEALVAATNDLGERLVATGLCRYHVTTRQGAYGVFISDLKHERTLVCGRPSSDTVSAADFGNAKLVTTALSAKNPLSRLFGVGAVVSTLYWVPEWTNYGWEIQQKFHDYAWMGPQFTSALEGYRTLKPAIPDRAYAVITGPDGEGAWKVFVAKEDVMVAYEPPWTREFKRAVLQAKQAREALDL